jgi:ribosomal-protein-alanine N-acetyltransferase
MGADDVKAVGRLERVVFGREAWPATAFAYLVTVFAAARPPRGRLWVAGEAEGKILGYVGLELSALGGEADVINLAVHPGHRRRGLGRRLLGTATAYCRRRGIAVVWLRVRPSNGIARTFYRRCGFRAVGRFRDYYDDPREDAVLMALARSGRAHRRHTRRSPGAAARRGRRAAREPERGRRPPHSFRRRPSSTPSPG